MPNANGALGFSRSDSKKTRKRMRNVQRGLLLYLLAGFLVGIGALPLSAQTLSTIQGTVTDPAGAALPDVEIKVSSPVLGTERTATSNEVGSYRIPALPAGTYKLTASREGFATRVVEGIEVVLNRVVTLDVILEVGALEQEVTVEAVLPLLQTTTSDSRSTLLPRQIVDMPLNGRNYLDLMQLVPGVAINRQDAAAQKFSGFAEGGDDTATAVLGERGGNAIFLIDGMPNRNELEGGPAAQFNQDTIQEFEVLTTGFKAEFGHGSGGIFNVITRSGSNAWHGSAFLFHRNSALDRNNSLDLDGDGQRDLEDAPLLLRWDYGVTLGGPIVKDKFFFFGSAERIRESRRLNFVFPPATPQTIRDFESGFDDPSRTYDTRLFAKLDEQLGQHHLSQEINVTNSHLTDFLPLSASNSLPSTRMNIDSRTTMLGFRDTSILGEAGNPFVLGAYFQYREEPSGIRPAHPESGASTLFNMFDSMLTGGLFGNLGQISFGASLTPSELVQEYVSWGANLAKHVGRHDIQFGIDFIRTKVDGFEASNRFNQLFATLDDFDTFGPLDAGFYTLRSQGPQAPGDELIGLRNNYVGLYFQNDWEVHRNLTLNLGLRWDYDSEFPDKNNVSPRLGAAWAITPKTVVRGSWGFFYDHFRLGIGRDIPEFGGASIAVTQPFTYPRLFFGVPTAVPILVGLCLHPTLTDAEIGAAGVTCADLPGLAGVLATIFGLGGATPFGVDHLGCVVAPGSPCVPANTVITLDNVQSLTGLTPQAFLDQASVAAGMAPGFFFWGGFGHLTHEFRPGGFVPVSVDPRFRTPYTNSLNVGVQREITKDLVVAVDYFHKNFENVLGVRFTNLAFESRVSSAIILEPGTGADRINGFGPWYGGTYDGLTVSLDKRFSNRFSLAANYTFAHARDNLRCASLNSSVLAGSTPFFCVPSDSFVGIPPVVTDPGTSQTNATSSFILENAGVFVAQADVPYNGPDLDRGPSSLALEHSFVMYGLVELPAGFQVSGIFRAQSGFPYTQQNNAFDPDGDNLFVGTDWIIGRNAFNTRRYVNLDVRFTKLFQFGERVRATALIEFFNLFNRQNPAAVQTDPGVVAPPLHGTTQVLPGMETQVGLKIEF